MKLLPALLQRHLPTNATHAGEHEHTMTLLLCMLVNTNTATCMPEHRAVPLPPSQPSAMSTAHAAPPGCLVLGGWVILVLTQRAAADLPGSPSLLTGFRGVGGRGKEGVEDRGEGITTKNPLGSNLKRA